MSKTGWIFPGQASQKVGMGKDIFDNSSIAKEYFDLAEKIMGCNIKSIIFDGPEEKLKRTEYTQPAIYIISVLIGSILIKKGIRPDYLAGHSLGEYSALTIGGSFDFETGLLLVKTRSENMAKASLLEKGKMAAIIGMDIKQLDIICSSYNSSKKAVIANYNAPGQLVISGNEKAVEDIMQIAKKNGARLTVELKVSGAFHSPLMSPAREQLAELINSLEISDTICPLFSNVDAKPIMKSEEIKNSLIKQLESPVQWTNSVLGMKNLGVNSFIEIGPGSVLKGLNKRIDKSLTTQCVGTYEQLEKLIV